MSDLAELHKSGALQIAGGDSVAVALTDLDAGSLIEISGRKIRVATAIKKGHKIALVSIEAGGPVLKYGHLIGLATSAIAAGDHVHTHNLRTALTETNGYIYAPQVRRMEKPVNHAGFKGYLRADDRAGTRNEIWIIATVGCVAKVCQRIEQEARRLYAGQVDNVVAITHPFGCSQLGDDLGGTRQILASLASHPNAGGVVIVGLGCESNQMDALLAAAPHLDRTRIRTVRSQSETDEVEAGLNAVRDLVECAALDRRVDLPLSKLVIGLKCGGSDGFSGLTANPLLGRLTDQVCAAGGSAILTEIPEIFGAETLLMDRCVSEAVFLKLADTVQSFKSYFISHGQPIYENPSPGNKEGGITTLEEKSLGAVQKGGLAPVTDVIPYGERQSVPGLTLLESPGNDAVSSTALAAAGANVILFTTGRGTPLGSPVPTLKIASNSDLAVRKPRWIDFDAGRVLDTAEGSSMAALSAEFLACVCATASGKPACNEINDERSIAIWKRGVTL